MLNLNINSCCTDKIEYLVSQVGVHTLLVFVGDPPVRLSSITNSPMMFSSSIHAMLGFNTSVYNVMVLRSPPDYNCSLAASQFKLQL